MEKEYSKESKNLESELFRRFITEQKEIDSRMNTVIWWVIGAIVPIFFTHKIEELKELASLTKHATVYSLVTVLGVAFLLYLLDYYRHYMIGKNNLHLFEEYRKGKLDEYDAICEINESIISGTKIFMLQAILFPILFLAMAAHFIIILSCYPIK